MASIVQFPFAHNIAHRPQEQMHGITASQQGMPVKESKRSQRSRGGLHPTST
jgi:hypothetical protein